eukprot:TRINITY_DN5232_c0_g1_i3.p1 TRINITY_DN5232_c0_g1~~TRINITY_DN5232_c0_g1_i3.p1  ORF type:complete len:668 (+),score=102.18 TRINITY_DN5232_c0_g1_i3:60-2063(+)
MESLSLSLSETSENAFEFDLPEFTEVEMQKLISVQTHIRRWLAQSRLRQERKDHVGALFRKLQGHVRGKNSRRRWAGLIAEYKASPESSQSRRRLKIIAELISTEESYVNGLRILIEHYIHNIEHFLPTLNLNANLKDQFLTLVSCVNTVFSANLLFLNDLRKGMGLWEKFDVSTFISKLIPRLRLYAPYINTYDETTKFLAKAAKQTSFANLLKKLETDPKAYGLTMASYLITPVQRIPRYQLLLQELIKNTPSGNAEYEGLESVLYHVKSIAVYINESKRESEKVSELSALEDCYAYPPELWPTEMRGWLAKSTRTTNVSKWDFYVLRQNKILRVRRGLQGTKVEDFLTIVPSSAVKFLKPCSASKSGFFAEARATFRTSGSLSCLDNQTSFEIHGENRTIRLYAQSEGFTKMWVMAIEQLIASLNKFEINVRMIEISFVSPIRCIERQESCQMIQTDYQSNVTLTSVHLALTSDFLLLSAEEIRNSLELLVSTDGSKTTLEHLECIPLVHEVQAVEKLDLTILVSDRFSYHFRFENEESRDTWKSILEQKCNSIKTKWDLGKLDTIIQPLSQEDWSTKSLLSDTLKKMHIVEKNTVSQNSMLIRHQTLLKEKEKTLNDIKESIKSNGLKKLYAVSGLYDVFFPYKINDGVDSPVFEMYDTGSQK